MARLDDWIRANVGTDEVLCLENPFLVNYSTERPAVIIPAGIAPGSFPGFLAAYRVRYFVANRDYTKLSRQEIDRLEKAVRAAGATKVAECGTYRVYRLEGRAGSLSTFFPHSARSASRCPSGSKSRRAPGKVAGVHPCPQNTLLYL